LLGEAKLLFSCSLQETLGISPYEGLLLDVIPMVPDRLSYTEMYLNTFKYPSSYTESFSSYEVSREVLCNKIVQYMTYYEQYLPQVQKQADYLKNEFFSATKLLENIK
jgi:hypothetical protein